VIVIGAGALGVAVVSALSATGVGTITIVEGNVSRVDAIADTVARRFPEVTLVRHPARFVDRNSFELLLDADLVVDASHDLATRYLANDAAEIRGIPMVWAVVSAEGGQVGVAWDEKGADYRDFAPEAADDAPEAAEVPSTLVAAVGELAAADAVKLLTGSSESLVGRVATIDAVTAARTELSFSRDPDAARPGSLEERTALREPDPERSVTPAKLQQLLAGDSTHGIHEKLPLLLDVREAPEASFVSLPGSVLIPLGALPDRLNELDEQLGHDRNASLVVYCHHGVRSARALDLLEKAGFTRVRHLTGGIDAWSVQVDPELPRY
jgi:adenylyltransferase/sulfurtransferase